MSKARFHVFSDSASFNNGYKQGKDIPQICTIGIVITLNEKIVYRGVKGFEGPHATISFGELTGAITVLDKLKEKIESLKSPVSKPYRVEVTSDSQFVIKGVNEWMKGWLRRGWKNNAGSPVGQIELWKDLKARYLDDEDWDIEWSHIKGHTGADDFRSQMNDLCDKIASKKLKEMKKEMGL
jgi:ribonuclease HI